MKNDPWVNSDWRAEMHVLLQEGSQEFKDAHILMFFTNRSRRLSTVNPWIIADHCFWRWTAL